MKPTIGPAPLRKECLSRFTATEATLLQLEEHRQRVEKTLWVTENLAAAWLEAAVALRAAASKVLGAALIGAALWLATHLHIQP